MIYYNKKPLKDLNWVKIGKELIKTWLHVIGIISLIGCAFFMNIAAYHFITVGGIIFYEFNMIISVIEFVMTGYAFFYAWYLLIKFYKNIK